MKLNVSQRGHFVPILLCVSFVLCMQMIVSVSSMKLGGWSEYSDCSMEPRAGELGEKIQEQFNEHLEDEGKHIISITPLQWKTQVVRGIKYKIITNVEHADGTHGRIEFGVYADIDGSVRLFEIDGQPFRPIMKPDIL
ncbi:hypothetical protein ADUPG1_001387 [Aduncisulcus paluster]|uniref:Uncharacterized protein n=1 Tax=Aduncisulcus paluster TaxID=2918883 RepID=A0ABQ5KC47_9EUKA|nr:hypothetical protein ADUPG1_001387 [Aduncisulcus paluster]